MSNEEKPRSYLAPIWIASNQVVAVKQHLSAGNISGVYKKLSGKQSFSEFTELSRENNGNIVTLWGKEGEDNPSVAIASLPVSYTHLTLPTTSRV